MPSVLPELRWNSYADYRAVSYIRAAIDLQRLGREDACRILAKEAVDKPDDQHVVVLCRMLFKQRAGAEFRRPQIGGADFLAGSEYADWPSEPIELQGGVPFLITRGYVLGGVAEPAGSYLKYCMANGDWNTDRFREPTAVALKSALADLMASGRWKRPLDSSERGFLSAQIE